MRIYVGTRNSRQEPRVFSISDGSRHFEVSHTSLDPRLDIANHSPTGLEWGYMGSGPSQLAIALIADATGDDEKAGNTRLCQQFKRDVIAQMPSREWILGQEFIVKYVESYLSEVPAWERRGGL